MTTSKSEIVAAVKAAVVSTIFPVGAIYMTTNSTNPGELFGGTWEAFAQGRTIIGAGISDQNFVAGTIGGASTHTLSAALSAKLVF